jgi:ABC-type oligopeptide transport system substrate-binding subunit
MPGHTAGIALPYDPEGARRLLAEAGYSERSAFPAVEFLTPPWFTQAAGYLATQWVELLGIEIEVVQLSWSRFLERIRTDPPAIYQTSWRADFPDPDNFLRLSEFRSSTGWRNENYERLVQQAREMMDQTGRMVLYRQAEEILVEEAPIIPLHYFRDSNLIKPWVRRFPTSPIKYWFWKDVVIEPH